MNVHFDQSAGIGATPHNQEINYFGFTCWMTPDMFLRLALKVNIDQNDRRFRGLKDLIKNGKPVASPFFNASWDVAKQVWSIDDHEGRHRVQAIKDLWPSEPIEVQVFPGSGLRARDMTPEMLQSFMKGVFAQDHTFVKNPTSKIECKGKTITPQQGQTPPSAGLTPPPMFETQRRKTKINETNAKDIIKGQLRRLIRKLPFHNSEKFKQQMEQKAEEIAQLVKPFHYQQALSRIESQGGNINKSGFWFIAADDALKSSPQARQAIEDTIWAWGLPLRKYEPMPSKNIKILTPTFTTKFTNMVSKYIVKRFNPNYTEEID